MQDCKGMNFLTRSKLFDIEYTVDRTLHLAIVEDVLTNYSSNEHFILICPLRMDNLSYICIDIGIKILLK